MARPLIGHFPFQYWLLLRVFLLVHESEYSGLADVMSRNESIILAAHRVIDIILSYSPAFFEVPKEGMPSSYGSYVANVVFSTSIWSQEILDLA